MLVLTDGTNVTVFDAPTLHYSTSSVGATNQELLKSILAVGSASLTSGTVGRTPRFSHSPLHVFKWNTCHHHIASGGDDSKKCHFRNIQWRENDPAHSVVRLPE